MAYHDSFSYRFGAAPVEPPGPELTLHLLGWVLLRKLPRMVLFALITGGLAYLASNLLTPQYGGTTKILVSTPDSVFLEPLGSGSRDRSRGLNDNFLRSQVQILQSREILLGALAIIRKGGAGEFAKLAPEPQGFFSRLLSFNTGSASVEEKTYKNFRKNLIAIVLDNSHVLQVSHFNADPVLAARGANAVAESYLDWQNRLRKQNIRRANNWLGDEIPKLREQVRLAENAVERFRNEIDLQQISPERSLDDQTLGDINARLIALRTRRSGLEVRIEQIRSFLQKKVDVLVLPDVLNSTLIQQRINQRVRVSQRIAELNAVLLPGHPRIQRAESELRALNRQIRTDAQLIVQSLSNEVAIARANEQAILDVLEEKKVHFSKSEQNKITLRALEREAKASRDLLESYLSRFNEAQTRERDEIIPTTVQIIEKARVLEVPSFPKKGWIAALAAGLTLFVYGGLVLVAELLKSSAPTAQFSGRNNGFPPEKESFNSAGTTKKQPTSNPKPGKETWRQERGAHPQGHIPMQSPGSSENNMADDRSEGMSAEAIVAHLRRLKISSTAVRLFLVTDETSPHDEKFVNLVRQISRQNGRTLFVDGTGRIAGFPRHLGLRAEPGLAELVREDAVLEDVVQAETLTELHFIASGRVGDEAFDSRSEDNFRQALAALCEVYEFVVVAVDRDSLNHMLTLMDGALDGFVVLGAAAREKMLQQAPGIDDEDIRIFQLDIAQNPIERLKLGKSRSKNTDRPHS